MPEKCFLIEKTSKTTRQRPAGMWSILLFVILVCVLIFSQALSASLNAAAPIHTEPEPDTAATLGSSPLQNDILTLEDDLDIPLVSVGSLNIPLFAPLRSASYALANLIFCVLSAVLLIVPASHAVHIKKLWYNGEFGEWDDHLDNVAAEDAIGFKELVHLKDYEKLGKWLRPGWFAVTIALVITGILLFLVTQDMTQPIILADIWTFAHIALFIAELIIISRILESSEGTRILRAKLDRMLRKSKTLPDGCICGNPCGNNCINNNTDVG